MLPPVPIRRPATGHPHHPRTAGRKQWKSGRLCCASQLLQGWRCASLFSSGLRHQIWSRLRNVPRCPRYHMGSFPKPQPESNERSDLWRSLLTLQPPCNAGRRHGQKLYCANMILICLADVCPFLGFGCFISWHLNSFSHSIRTSRSIPSSLVTAQQRLHVSVQ